MIHSDPLTLDVIEYVVLPIYKNQLAKKQKRDTLKLNAKDFEI